MKVAIMQPTFMPWAGYFDLIDQVDHFIFLDDVAFSRQSWQQRNRIRTHDRLGWVTLPVSFSHGARTTIRDASIADLRPIQKARLTIAQAYARAAHGARELPWIDAWLGSLEIGQSLADANLAFITQACAHLGIATPVQCASAFSASPRRADRLVDLCRAVGGDLYLSPLGAAAYLQSEGAAFADAGIALAFQNYEHPSWRQTGADFLPFASVVDLLLNEGPEAAKIIRSGRRDALSPAQAYARAHAVDAAEHAA
jgi:hypothetical protein